MNTIIVWLLIAVSKSSNGGTATTIERFATAGDCEYVRQNLPGPSYVIETKCVQAKIVAPR